MAVVYVRWFLFCICCILLPYCTDDPIYLMLVSALYPFAFIFGNQSRHQSTAFFSLRAAMLPAWCRVRLLGVVNPIGSGMPKHESHFLVVFETPKSRAWNMVWAEKISLFFHCLFSEDICCDVLLWYVYFLGSLVVYRARACCKWVSLVAKNIPKPTATTNPHVTNPHVILDTHSNDAYQASERAAPTRW